MRLSLRPLPAAGRWRQTLAFLTVPMLCLSMLTGTAFIATSAGASTGYFAELQNGYTGQCLTETGTTSGPWFIGTCVTSNHSLYWEWTGSTYNGFSYGE